MKTTILILTVLFSLNVFSQKAEIPHLFTIEQKIESFKPIIKDYLSKVENSSNLDSIKNYGKALEVESNALILEIKTTFKINEDYITENSTDMALSMVLPNLASFYQTSAILKMSDGLNQKTPNYLASLETIKENAMLLSKVRKTENVKKYQKQLQLGYQELIAIHSESK